MPLNYCRPAFLLVVIGVYRIPYLNVLSRRDMILCTDLLGQETPLDIFLYCLDIFLSQIHSENPSLWIRTSWACFQTSPFLPRFSPHFPPLCRLKENSGSGFQREFSIFSIMLGSRVISGICSHRCSVRSMICGDVNFLSHVFSPSFLSLNKGP